MTEEEIEGMKAYNAANARKTPEQPTLRDQFAMAATEADIARYRVEHFDKDHSVITISGVRYLVDNTEVIKYSREQARYRFADAMMEARK